MMFWYKLITGLLSEYFNSCILFNNEIHKYLRRSSKVTHTLEKVTIKEL